MKFEDYLIEYHYDRESWNLVESISASYRKNGLHDCIWKNVDYVPNDSPIIKDKISDIKQEIESKTETDIVLSMIDMLKNRNKNISSTLEKLSDFISDNNVHSAITVTAQLIETCQFQNKRQKEDIENIKQWLLMQLAQKKQQIVQETGYKTAFRKDIKDD